jgi:hypothetical protein
MQCAGSPCWEGGFVCLEWVDLGGFLPGLCWVIGFSMQGQQGSVSSLTRNWTESAAVCLPLAREGL